MEEFINYFDMQYVDDTSVHQASPSLKANVRYKEVTGFISNLLIHQILDEGTSFASETAAQPFIAGVAVFTKVMRDFNYKGTATYAMSSSMLQQTSLNDPYGYIAELKLLVETANRL
jgi:hypothetical protein